MLRFSLDSTLLADFVKVTNSTKKIIDLGTGNAPIPLFLTLKTTAKIYGIEIQKDVAELAQKSVDINSFNEQIEIINADIKGIYKLVGANIFDIVTSNPPYFKYLETSNINKNDYLTIARHEVLITLEDIVVESTKLLGDGGFLYMVHRCERLPEIIQTLTKYGFGIKKMRFVHSKTTDDKALLVLIAARKNKKSDVEIFKPLFVYNSELEYTEEVKKIFNRK